jgi:hypothetical protein
MYQCADNEDGARPGHRLPERAPRRGEAVDLEGIHRVAMPEERRRHQLPRRARGLRHVASWCLARRVTHTRAAGDLRAEVDQGEEVVVAEQFVLSEDPVHQSARLPG